MILRLIKRLWGFLRYIVLAEKVWQWPRQSDLLIFDAAGREFLLGYCSKWNPETLHVRGESINMRVLFSSFFREGKPSDAYCDCFIEKVNPRLIVTLVDNNLAFYSLATRHPSVKTLFIQNGIRGSEIFDLMEQLDKPKHFYRVDFMLTFNRHIGAKFSEHIDGSVVPIGSFRNNLYQTRVEKTPGVIAFISQYRGNSEVMLGDKCFSRREFFDQCDKIVLQFLVAYSRKHGKKLLVVRSGGANQGISFEAEQQYFEQLLGVRPDFSNQRQSGTSYTATDAAEVVVSIDSTLAYESIARGNKTAVFSVRKTTLHLSDRAFGWPAAYPDDGPFWTTRADPASFGKILDHLFSVSADQWRAEMAGYAFENILEYDPGNTILQSVLQHALAGSRLRAAA